MVGSRAVTAGILYGRVLRQYADAASILLDGHRNPRRLQWVVGEIDGRRIHIVRRQPQFKNIQGKLKMAVIEVAKVILFDRNQQVLIYLRDNKPNISYPNY